MENDSVFKTLGVGTFGEGEDVAHAMFIEHTRAP